MVKARQDKRKTDRAYLRHPVSGYWPRIPAADCEKKVTVSQQYNPKPTVVQRQYWLRFCPCGTENWMFRHETKNPGRLARR